jgi:hypothetical protein
MSLSERCAARSLRSRALIILVSKHVLVESGMRDLGRIVRFRSRRSRKRKTGEKTPCSCGRRSRLDPHVPLSETIAAPPVAARLLGYAPPLPPSHSRLPPIALPVASFLSRSTISYFQHRMFRTIHPVLSPYGLCGQGVTYMACVLSR